MNKKTFTSISSDNNVFDLTHIVRTIARGMGLSQEDQFAKVRECIRRQNVGELSLVSDLRATALMADHSSIENFTKMMDALGCKIAIDVEYKALGPKTDYPDVAATFTAFHDKDITELNLTVRVENVLKANNVLCFGELAQQQEKDVARFINMGAKGMQQLKDAMKKHALTFGSDLGTWLSPNQREAMGKYQDLEINSMKISTSAAGRLHQMGITTIKDLISKTEDYVSQISGITRNDIYQMRELLDRRGLKFGMLPSVAATAKPTTPVPVAPGMDNPAFNIHIDDLNVAGRIKNILKSEKIEQLGEVVRLSEDALMRIPNLGRKNVDEIKDALAVRGFYVGMDTGAWKSRNDLEKYAQNQLTETRNHALFDRTIDYLGLENATLAALQGDGVEQIGDLIKFGIDRLRKLPNVGSVRVNRVKMALNKHNVSFDTPLGSWTPTAAV